MTYTETEQCLFEVITMEGLPFEENMLLIDYYKEVISEEAYRYLKEIVWEQFLAELAMMRMRIWA